MVTRMELEARLKVAVARVHRAAGIDLAEKHLESLARVYADWGEGADEGIVDRIERALAKSLGLSFH